jgi:hypothetical protein
MVCYGGHIYAAGGNDGSGATDLFYIYDIAAGTWSQAANLPHPLKQAAIGAWDGHLYLAGGTLTSAPWPPIDHVDVYDIASNTWSDHPGEHMPVATDSAGYYQQGFYLYIVGGWSGDFSHNVSATQRYDMATGAWESGPVFTSARAAFALAGNGSHLYAIGGDADGGTQGDPTDMVESLDLSTWPGGAWVDIVDPLPLTIEGNSAGFCSESVSGGEIWSVGGAENWGHLLEDVYYRPTGEPCFDFYFGDLQPESLATTGMASETVTYTLSIHNDGTMPDTFDISASAVWTTTFQTPVGPLAPGESAELLVRVEIPLGGAPGESDTAIVTATSQGDPAAADVATLTTAVTEWVEATPIPFGVAYYGFAQCPDQPNSFYVISGAYDYGIATNNVWRYDADTNTWNALEPILVSVIGPAAVCYAGQIYAVAAQLQVYDIESNSWINRGFAPRLLYGSAVGAWDGKLYRVSGSPGGWNNPVNNVDVYDIATNTWQLDGGAPIPEAAFASGYMQVGQYLYLVGGNSTDSPAYNVAVAQRYDMATNTWAQIEFPSARGMGFALAHSGDQLYAIGGDLDGNDYYDVTDMVETLDLAAWPDSSWDLYYDPFPYSLGGNSAGFCTEAVSGGEIWSVAGGYLDDQGNAYMFDANMYHPTGEPCVHYGVDLSAPLQGEGEIGHQVEYSLTITNTGTITDYFNLTISTTWGAGSILGGPGPVGPGDSIQVIVGVQIPENVDVGDQGLSVVTVTSLRDSVIMDTTLITTTVTGSDVHLNPDSLAVSGFHGETITYTLTISNMGDITDTVNLTYTGNTWVVLLPVTSFDLGIGESAEVVIYVTIPTDAMLGDTDVLVLTATSAGNPFAHDSSTLTTTAFWYRMLLPLTLKN